MKSMSDAELRDLTADAFLAAAMTFGLIRDGLRWQIEWSMLSPEEKCAAQRAFAALENARLGLAIFARDFRRGDLVEETDHAS